MLFLIVHLSFAFASQDALAQGPLSLELLVRPEWVLREDPSGGGLVGAPGLAIEAGLVLPGGSIFDYGLRLRAGGYEGVRELSGLAEARVQIGLAGAPPSLQPVLRGGIRIGRRSEGAEQWWLLGPHLQFGVALTLPGGAVLELSAGGYGEVLPFGLGLGGQLVIRGPD